MNQIIFQVLIFSYIRDILSGNLIIVRRKKIHYPNFEKWSCHLKEHYFDIRKIKSKMKIEIFFLSSNKNHFNYELIYAVLE